MTGGAAARLAALAATLLARSLGGQAPWHYESPATAPRTAFIRDVRLAESSGVATSRTQPGVLWTHGDSGADPLVFAIDTMGRVLGAFRVSGAVNVDWEAIRAAPCPPGSCLYIADIGDNTAVRRDVVIYRLAEPRVDGASTAPRPTAPATALRVHYPDGAHDAEALIVTPSGDMLIITKGGAEAARVYRVRASAWKAPGVAAAEFLETLPIAVDAASFRLVTDAALAPDGVRAVVRTYRDLYFFRLTPRGLAAETPPRACNILGLEIQGEGVDWLDAHTLVLTSERALAAGASVSLVDCAGGG